ncbi:DUF5916 domain-containing protein [Portibacter marinus]|uniref:DUF5916 domain-containing protein n=1 Tax=Portibacter marinus TaxID=2898660 RepID=UPI001F1FCD46|nr:DUF5916 domain-containing protein [Portibacter marinus]
MKRNCLLLVLFFACYQLNAQKSATVAVIDQPITLDGALEEEVWQLSKPASDFWQYFPSDSVLAENQSEIYFLYDDKNLYIGFKCYSSGKDYVVPTLKRDFRAGGNDNITIMIDPFNDRINAFLFGTNPFGVQREGLVAGGGEDIDNFSVAWDSKWKCNAKIFDDYWTAEMEIPLNILRFNPGVDKWSFNSYRFDTQANEQSTWNQIPRNQWIFNLAFMGEMLWDQPPVRPKGGGNAIIPYVTAGHSKNYEKNSPANFTYNFGGDAKIAVTPSLNLDLTFNPDFSQVEVDEQVTNVDRFEIFFPERRQFFLENADLFGGFGTPRINPFFSRRIGVSRDTTTGNAIQNTIYAGARLSGKLNEDVRLGLLSMQTAADPVNGLPDYNYSIFSIQKKIYTRSNIGFIFVNKQAFGEVDASSNNDRYNRVLGLDYNLATDDNTWTGKAFLHRSISEEGLPNPWAQGTSLRYNKRMFFVQADQQYVGEGYDAQVGFVRRQNFLRFSPSAGLNFYPTNGFVNQHGPSLEWTYFNFIGVGNTDRELQFEYQVEFNNNSEIGVEVTNTYVYLLGDFDPTGTGSEKLSSNTDYNYTAYELSYRSNRNLDFSFSLSPNFGQYFNGTRYGLRGFASYRYQPYGQFSLSYSYNHFEQDHLKEAKRTVLLGPRLDISFNKALFLTTVVQYNSQITNMNVNARLQWRFAPVSDLYIVYTDNYFTDITDDPADRFITQIRNRSLVAKVTYWLNI